MRISMNTNQTKVAETSSDKSRLRSRVRSRSRWFAALLAGSIVSGDLGQNAWGQQPALTRLTTPRAFAQASSGMQTPPAAIKTVLTDTAIVGNEPMFPNSLSQGIYQPQSQSRQAMQFSSLPSVSGARNGVVIPVSGTNPSKYHIGQEPEGDLLSSKIISSSEPVIVAQQDLGPDGKPLGKLTSITGMPVDGTGYGFDEAASVPGSFNQYGTNVSSGTAIAPVSGYSMGGGNTCCPEDCRRWYGGYEAVYLQREGDRGFSISRGNFLTDYGYEFGHRITIGQMLDCTDAIELVYTGPFTWERTSQDLSPTGQLQSVLTTGGGYVPAQIDTFNNSIRHLQGHRATFQSYEANRKWFAWDIMSTLIGIRAIQYDEIFSFDSVAQDLGAGFFRTSQSNFLIGGQIGSDVMRPVSQRLSIGSRTRLGVFGNFNEGAIRVANRGVNLINAKRKDTDIAGLIQLGAIARYRILPKLVATAGYEAMYLAGIATASNQRYLPLNPGSGGRFSADDIILFHGGTFGLELSY